YMALYPLTYVGVALSTWISALAWHVPLKILGGKGSYEGTVRTVAYNSGVHVWHLVPVLGSVVAFVLWTFLNYHAFRNVHSMGKFRAGLAAAMPWILATAAIAAVVILGECNMFDVEPRVRMIRSC
ncbi:MAG TPA: YIP1 family protein, partial [Planctomycetota bacterium]|nr:YIP1 family protein [Planctomycetota bacterium]